MNIHEIQKDPPMTSKKVFGEQQSLGLKEYKSIVKSTVKKKRSKGEENLQLAVCKYIKLKYPDVIFMCDLASGMKMPIFMAARNKKMRSSSGLPDLFIACPKKTFHGYPIPLGDDDDGVVNSWNGLFIELKREGTKIENKKGGAATPHIGEQAKVLNKLNEVGYAACFCVGYDEAIKVIDAYLK